MTYWTELGLECGVVCAITLCGRAVIGKDRAQKTSVDIVLDVERKHREKALDYLAKEAQEDYGGYK